MSQSKKVEKKMKDRFTKEEWDSVRPYHDEEVTKAIERIAEQAPFYDAMEYLFPEYSRVEVEEMVRRTSTTYEFQRDFMHKGIRRILEKSSDGLTYEGFEKLSPKESSLFIANHRDIFLDSGILEILLFEYGLDTTQITFGSNLMSNPFITDVGKVNKMFTVFRDGTKREMYRNSLLLSTYIRTMITEEKDSIWIAQRNGRTKDGNDQTHSGVLKMLRSSGEKDFVQNFGELNIIPLTISYEFEPCDFYKVRELHANDKKGGYQKKKGEDMESILNGVIEHKGRVHMVVGEPIGRDKLSAIDQKEDNEHQKVLSLCQEIDRDIHSNYKLWPTNFMARDLLEGKKEEELNEYDPFHKERFLERMNKVVNNIEGDKEELKKYFLRIYANPVLNAQHA